MASILPLFGDDDGVDVTVEISKISSSVLARRAVERAEVVDDPDFGTPLQLQNLRTGLSSQRHRGVLVAQALFLEVGLVDLTRSVGGSFVAVLIRIELVSGVDQRIARAAKQFAIALAVRSQDL